MYPCKQLLQTNPRKMILNSLVNISNVDKMILMSLYYQYSWTIIHFSLFYVGNVSGATWGKKIVQAFRRTKQKSRSIDHTSTQLTWKLDGESSVRKRWGKSQPRPTNQPLKLAANSVRAFAMSSISFYTQCSRK